MNSVYAGMHTIFEPGTPKYGNVEVLLHQHSQSLLFIDATT